MGRLTGKREYGLQVLQAVLVKRWRTWQQPKEQKSLCRQDELKSSQVYKKRL